MAKRVAKAKAQRTPKVTNEAELLRLAERKADLNARIDKFLAWRAENPSVWDAPNAR